MTEEMEHKILGCIKHHDMLQSGNNVIVALSGGADSVALFHFLLTHRQQLGIRLGAAHFEHGLRGAESLEDAAYVQSLCDAPGIPFFIEHGEMAARTAPKGVGVEEWGRRLRYAFFDRLAKEQRAKIATAHNLGDNAETVLFNAIRGAGTRGLAGIPPVRGAYIRPLLWAGREEIEAYCAAHRLHYIQDSYNFNLNYSRNRIRAQVLPLLEQAHPGAKQSLARLAADMAELDGWLEEQAQALRESSALQADALLAAPAPVRRKLLAMLAGRAITREALGRMEAVLAGSLPAAQLPGGKTARLEKGALALADTTAAEIAEAYEIPLKTGEYTLPGGHRLRVEVAPAAENGVNCEKTGQNTLPFVADYDKISKCSVFRPRRTGDVFSPKGRGLTKTVKKWMNEEKIPPARRQLLPMLCDGSKALWIWGAGFCEGLAPNAATRELLMIYTDGGEG